MIITRNLVLGIACFLFIISVKAQNKGEKSPEFTLSDINGNKVSLSDFKGKIVYLDFWASWCGPCLKEIPSSKKLQATFKDNPSIVFINISFDHDTVQWKKAINSKKMIGIQLISAKGRESNVLENYRVATIPRTVIIDKKGIIVENDAPLPSDKSLIDYLTALSTQ